MRYGLAAACAAGLLTATAGLAKDNNVGIFGTSGKTMGDHIYIDQNSEKAASLREILKNITLPPGFKIELYAIVPDARDMAMAPQGTVLFVGTRKDKVWVVSDRDRDGVADEVKDFAPSLEFDVPNGLQFSNDGFLYIAERNHVRMFPAAEFFYEGPDVVAVDVVAKGDLIPEGEESYNHTARVIDIGPDNKLYISLGQPYNVAPPEKLELYKETGIGGIIRMD
ncbi:MAG: sorbosone dehydrogenase, partial [Rhodobacteraceae bacterium]|nr:sorbosone dehydrogenase [Paracoccaceae bacterium]